MNGSETQNTASSFAKPLPQSHANNAGGFSLPTCCAQTIFPILQILPFKPSLLKMFIGTVSSVHVADPFRWPDSPWRLLQVTWDEPILLHNVERASPWLVELVSNMPAINPSSFQSPLKKLRFSQHPDFPLNCEPESSPAGVQGARHAYYVSLQKQHGS